MKQLRLKRFRARFASAALISAVTILGFQNCDQTRLVLNTELASAKSDGEICAVVPTTFANPTKVLFVVDKSGSNLTTDTNQFRVRTISTFFQKHVQNPMVKWGVVVFSGAASEGYINNGSTQQPTFSADPTRVQAAIARIGTDPDFGATPYRSALSMARAAVTFDITANANEISSYVIVLLSDGTPTDYGTPIDEMAIDTDVQNLKTAGRVSLSTVYYGPVDPAASGRLMRMSALGGGQFLDTNIDGQIPIDSLIGFSTAEPWVIKNIVVTNMNGAPCDDGTIDADSDADSLCDKDEIRYNAEFRNDPVKMQRLGGRLFDPSNRNSFSTYLNDSLWYKFAVFGEALPLNCTDASDPDRDLLNNCEEQYMRSSTPVGPTQRWTDAMGTDADPFNFDSDGDGYLDWFEYAMTRNKSSGLDHNNINQLYLGLRLDTIFQQHRNWRNPASSPAYDGEFKFSRVNASGQNCYTYKQTVLPLYRTAAVANSQVSGISGLEHAANENVVMVYFLQSPERDPNGPGELRYSFQRVSQSSNQVRLNLSIDQYSSYRVGQESRVKP